MPARSSLFRYVDDVNLGRLADIIVCNLNTFIPAPMNNVTLHSLTFYLITGNLIMPPSLIRSTRRGFLNACWQRDNRCSNGISDFPFTYDKSLLWDAKCNDSFTNGNLTTLVILSVCYPADGGGGKYALNRSVS